MTPLRVIEETEIQSCVDGLSGDEALAHCLAEGTSPATLRLYQYQPCAIVGCYQNLTDAIDTEACVRHGLTWNRRHTGGGTVLMGPGQVAIALTLADAGAGLTAMRDHFQRFAAFVAHALKALGLRAELEGKNDLLVDGRKIAGLAISQDIDGVVFCHGSLLVDFDVSMMVDVLNLATRELDDKGQSCFAQRMTTIREHRPAVTLDEVRGALVAAAGIALDLPHARGEWLLAERDRIASLMRDRYTNDSWIYSTRVMRRWTGSAEMKTSGGNMRIYVDRSGGILDAVLITGDYFCRSLELARLESRLRGVPATPPAVQQAIGENDCDGIYRLPASTLADLILAAAEKGGPRFTMGRPPRHEATHTT